MTAFPVYADEINIKTLNQSGDDSIIRGKIDGETAAEENYSGNRWLAGGIASGFFGSLLGTGIITGVSQSGTVDPPATLLLTLLDKPDSYKTAYLLSYSKKAKRKRLSKSIIGGLIGTVAFISLIIITGGLELGSELEFDFEMK